MRNNTNYLAGIFAFNLKESQSLIWLSNGKPKPEPKMRVEKFSSDGKIVFAFDQEMLIP